MNSSLSSLRLSSQPARAYSDENASDDATKNDAAPKQRTGTRAIARLGRGAERIVAVMWKEDRDDKRG